MAAGGDTFHHVRDSSSFELPFGNEFGLPSIPIPGYGDFQITKFMVLQVLAAVIVFLIFRGLTRRIEGGQAASGRWLNFWEMLAVFVRDEMVRPTIGDPDHHDDHPHGPGDDHGGQIADDEAEPARSHIATPHATTGEHPADRYLPYVWSVFFYVLICNLLGAIPFLGSATGNLNVTGVLAIIAFGATLVHGMRKSGPIGFWLALVPTMDLSPVLKVALMPMIWVIELVGLFIKHAVLAIRLFANILAGHTVLGVFLGFIATTSGTGLWYLVMPASIFGQIAIGLLELLVALIQAYVFAFLSTLFIASVIHDH